ncbi:MAG: HPP family protein [Pseudomonadota bacterium]|nr:HPP family protein [Pseudomonadota bacterium]
MNLSESVPGRGRWVINRLGAGLLAGGGAALCISLLAALQNWQSVVLLMAPFGATMVILFVLPESPLAQPRNIIGGHLLTVLAGFLVQHWLGVDVFTLGLATGLGVFLMVLTGTTHPPAGANPLLIMLTQPAFSFVLTPVLSGVAVIVLFGVLYHRVLLRRRYPLRWF